MPSTPTSSHQPDFRGLWIPLVTPFRAGAIDHAALRALVQTLGTQGVRGFVACGSTGEAAALSKAEQSAVLETVLEAANGLPVIMGLSAYHLPDMHSSVQSLARYPLAGVLLPAPHYIRPPQSGLLQWFQSAADASAAPIVVYDIPARTGALIELDTLRTLAAHPNICAIKDCAGDAAKTQALIADGRLQVLAGNDAEMFATLALGGSGAIAASAHWQAAQFVELIALIEQGALPQARQVWRALWPWIQACFDEPNPGPLKAMLADAGWMANELRAPMAAASAALQSRLRALALTPP